MSKVVYSCGCIFSPGIRLGHFFKRGVSKSRVFLVSRTRGLMRHNERVCDTNVSHRDLMTLQGGVEGEFSGLTEALSGTGHRVVRLRRGLTRAKGKCRILPGPKMLPVAFLAVSNRLRRVLRRGRLRRRLHERVLRFCFVIHSFLGISRLMSRGCMMCARGDTRRKFHLELFYIGPTRGLKRCLGGKGDTVFFSTAVFPVLCCQRLLAASHSTCKVCIRSPFPGRGHEVLVNDSMDDQCAQEGHTRCQGVTKCVTEYI